jgi:hypothetical protein
VDLLEIYYLQLSQRREKPMSILKILSNIEKATQTVDKISTMFDEKEKTPAPKKTFTSEEREMMVKARIKAKGLQAVFQDIYPDL